MKQFGRCPIEKQHGHVHFRVLSVDGRWVWLSCKCRCTVRQWDPAEAAKPKGSAAPEEPTAPVPDAPSGPKAKIPDATGALKREATLAFLATDIGKAFYVAMCAAAHAVWDLYCDGDEKVRFSTRTYLGEYRKDLRVEINDHFSPTFSDILLERFPYLKPIIERRERKVA